MNTSGLLTCARYAYPPNALSYCGPLKADTIKGYIENDTSDPGLQDILCRFETVYPYLSCIAYENNIRDPFDPSVIEAYWIGNNLLQNVSLGTLYDHYVNRLHLPKRIAKKELRWLVDKIPQGAVAHHTFHVLNIFIRTGHHTIQHTLSTMDNCRISWGKVLSGAGTLTVLTQPLILEKNKLKLAAAEIKTIANPTNQAILPGSVVSYHWGVVCDILSKKQVLALQQYTTHALQLANLTL